MRCFRFDEGETEGGAGGGTGTAFEPATAGDVDRDVAARSKEGAAGADEGAAGADEEEEGAKAEGGAGAGQRGFTWELG